MLAVRKPRFVDTALSHRNTSSAARRASREPVSDGPRCCVPTASSADDDVRHRCARRARRATAPGDARCTDARSAASTAAERRRTEASSTAGGQRFVLEHRGDQQRRKNDSARRCRSRAWRDSARPRASCGPRRTPRSSAPMRSSAARGRPRRALRDRRRAPQRPTGSNELVTASPWRGAAAISRRRFL